MNLLDLYNLYIQSYLVSTDTRKITKDSIFFALKGANFNGNAFAEEALEKGASYAVIDEAAYQTNDQIILVDNALETLQQLARHHRRQLGIPIISLTGSNGKTTTKELINAVLSKKFHTTATLGNLNNHIGVPLTLLAMHTETEFGIVEMGANHLKEIELLCSIAEPDYGYITNFGKAHLEGFGSLEGVVQGKTELYRHLKANDKLVFVNANDARQLEESKGMQRITFGERDSDIQIQFIEADPFVKLQYKDIQITSQLIGSYNFNNIAAAITIGTYFKIEDALIKNAIENYIPSNNRSQVIQKGKNTIILDAYNANPTSMQAALEHFSGLTDSPKIAILGDMFELGADASEEHQKIADLATGFHLDKVYLLGENFHKVSNEKVGRFKSFEDFKEYFSGRTPEDATLLIKASRGMALERILDLFE
ncbi:MAG: UDP-N-acetylmuramoyl-tripeptide--D-alanyl-D-alanine ligase [Flavobacteriaceae bacterium]|nr:UDP-N-acetylmuramoyl-tripeptide--D-alanyl-D-alanine ligase [Flavobacteriaceae bacterium]